MPKVLRTRLGCHVLQVVLRGERFKTQNPNPARGLPVPALSLYISLPFLSNCDTQKWYTTVLCSVRTRITPPPQPSIVWYSGILIGKRGLVREIGGEIEVFGCVMRDGVAGLRDQHGLADGLRDTTFGSSHQEVREIGYIHCSFFFSIIERGVKE